MRLNWLSPLPPAQTGVAQITGHLAPALHGRFDVTFWSDQEQWDRSLENYGRVRRLPERFAAETWAALNAADMNIYHIGNNTAFHSAIWQISREIPGIVVLHDLRLQHFFAGFYLHRQDRNGYIAAMRNYYGGNGAKVAEAFFQGGDLTELAREFPLTPLALENSLAAVIHASDGFDLLGQSSRYPAACLPLPYIVSPELASAEPRRRRNSGPPYDIAIMGYLAPNRRLDAVFRALAGFEGADRFRLHIYGPLWDSDYVKGVIRDCHLESMVALHGYTRSDELQTALQSAHLAINLRFPSMGEASLSQLTIWDHALPALVTETGWYRALPPDTVAFVRPEHEIEDIRAHLASFLRNPSRFAEMGENGRKFLERKHTPELYVSGLLQLIEDAQAYRPYAVALDLAGRAGAALKGWVHPAVQDILLDRTATEIHELSGCGSRGLALSARQ